MKRRLHLDFLVLGAAKAGTTTLHHYLANCPGVVLPKIKETNFFALEGTVPNFQGPLDNHTINKFSVTTPEDYAAMFEQADANAIRGEVCPYYLYSEQAPQNILRYCSNAKLVILLRNPVDRAFSNYLHLVRDGRETETFESALALERQRMEANWEWFWHLLQQGYYSKQLQRYFDLFERSQIKVFIFEQFFSNLRESLEELYGFFGIADGCYHLTETTYNQSGRPVGWIKPLYRVLMSPGGVNSFLRSVLPDDARKKISESFKMFSTRAERIPEALRHEMFNLYADEIDELESMLAVNLDVWRPS